MRGDGLCNPRLRDGPRGGGDGAAGPQGAAPDLVAEVRALREPHPGADARPPLDDLADPLVRAVGEQEVDLVACALPGAKVAFRPPRALAAEVADPAGHRSAAAPPCGTFGLQPRELVRSHGPCGPVRKIRTRPVDPTPGHSPAGEGYPPSLRGRLITGRAEMR